MDTKEDTQGPPIVVIAGRGEDCTLPAELACIFQASLQSHLARAGGKLHPTA